MSHDTRSRTQVLSGQLNECPHAFEPGGFPGFGYLFDDAPNDNPQGENPGNGARSQLGADPARAHQLLLALSQALPPGRGYWEAPLQAGLDPDDNPRIPSGYTYLLQLVAHDVVQTSVPFWAAAAHGLASRNLRSSPLVLDTLYGGGPSTSPVAYNVAGYSAADRTTLRVGRYQSANTGRAGFRDLARINAYTEPGEVLPANFDFAYVTCAADARNDDNLVLSQLTALFANVHGAIAQRVRATRPEAIFGYAQVAVQRIYHAVVAHDLLPKLLHPRMNETLESLRDPTASARRWLWQNHRMPLEFTHGAFRVGHAMVRHKYQVNNTPAGALGLPDVVDGGPRWAETRLPVREGWLVQWSRFFQMPEAETPNLSRRISPTQSAIDAADLFRSTDPGQPDGLAMRDMLSGALARTWHVDALLARILAENSNPIPSDWLLHDENRRRDEIHGWLSTRCSGLTAPQIDTLSSDPPLPFFVLLESALDPAIAGRHLGPLGSIIIGEVIGRTIAQERRGMEAVQCAAERAFPSDFWDEMTAITSMRQLIEFAARHCEYAAAPAPFI